MAAATFENALRKVLKDYWQGKDHESAMTFKNVKYNKKYFDDFNESEKTSKLEVDKKKGK